MPTKTKKRTRKSTPDLMNTLKTAQRKAEGETMTANQIADCFEAEAKRLKGFADILRGKTK